MKLMKAILTLSYVDENTGELEEQEYDVLDVISKKAATKSKSTSRTKLIEDDTPKLIVEDNKYCLTSGAIKMLNVTPGEDSLEIEYQKIGKEEYPLIGIPQAYGNADGGNKLTKSGTVRLGGIKHDRLVEHGNEFILTKHPNAENLFILTVGGVVPKGDASLESIKKDRKKNPPKKSMNIAPEKQVEQPEPEDDVNDLQHLLEEEDNKDFNMNDFTL